MALPEIAGSGTGKAAEITRKEIVPNNSQSDTALFPSLADIVYDNAEHF